jgi:hypothetical protein
MINEVIIDPMKAPNAKALKLSILASLCLSNLIDQNVLLKTYKSLFDLYLAYVCLLRTSLN